MTDDTWQQFERTLRVPHSRAGVYQLAFYSENNDEGVPFAVDSLSFVRTAPTTPEFLRLENVTEDHGHGGLVELQCLLRTRCASSTSRWT